MGGIPRKANNLLVTCCAFASEAIANNYFDYIPHCIALGQVALPIVQRAGKLHEL
jgi:hypothetical protein